MGTPDVRRYPRPVRGGIGGRKNRGGRAGGGGADLPPRRAGLVVGRGPGSLARPGPQRARAEPVLRARDGAGRAQAPGRARRRAAGGRGRGLPGAPACRSAASASTEWRSRAPGSTSTASWAPRCSAATRPTPRRGRCWRRGARATRCRCAGLAADGPAAAALRSAAADLGLVTVFESRSERALLRRRSDGSYLDAHARSPPPRAQPARPSAGARAGGGAGGGGRDGHPRRGGGVPGAGAVRLEGRAPDGAGLRRRPRRLLHVDLRGAERTGPARAAVPARGRPARGDEVQHLRRRGRLLLQDRLRRAAGAVLAGRAARARERAALRREPRRSAGRTRAPTRTTR